MNRNAFEPTETSVAGTVRKPWSRPMMEVDAIAERTEVKNIPINEVTIVTCHDS